MANKSMVWIEMILISIIVSCNSESVAPAKGGQLFERTLITDGVERKYLINVPSGYSEDVSIPLLFSFHGLGGNMQDHYDRTEMYRIAERETFILVTPQGEASFGIPRWTLNPDGINATDDIGFVVELINEIINTYNIDENRIYSQGMSNGGFFSFDLACQLSNRIAAFASVTGAMTPPQYARCDPERTVPFLQIHGTSDNIVPYAEAEKVIDYWKGQNNVVGDSTVLEIDSRATRIIYRNVNDDTVIEHIMIENGEHDWFGDSKSEYKGIKASEETWKFLSGYQL